MKKLLSVLAVSVFALVVSTSFVLAEGSNSGSSDSNSGTSETHRSIPRAIGGFSADLRDDKEQIKDKLKNESELLHRKQEELKEKNSSRSAEFKQRATEELKKNFGKLDLHLLAYLDRLNKIADKIDSRIAKLKARGVDTSAAEAKMASAKVLGDAAAAAIQKAVTDIGSVSSTAATQESIMNARQSVEAARRALVAYHKGLSDVVRILARSTGLKESTGSANEK